MAIVTTNNQYYTDIAAAIRQKNGEETLYKPSEMAEAIMAINNAAGEQVKTGSVSFAQTTNVVDYEITHNLGKMPTAFGWAISKKITGIGWNESVAWMLFATTSFLTSVGSQNLGYYSQLAGKNLQQDGIALLEATESTIKLAVSGALPSDKDAFKSGESIEWFIW